MIKKANQFVCFMFGDVKLLDLWKFLGGATRLDSFLEAYKTSKTKGYFLYECYNDPEKFNNTQSLPYESFFSKLHNNNSLNKDYSDFQSLIYGGLISKEALSELKMKHSAANGPENYQYLTSVCNEKTCVSLNTFCAVITRTLFLRSKVCKRWLFFNAIKELIC